MPEDTPIRNALTVDLEDYFQVSAFEDVVQREDWDNYPSRVEANVDRILRLFDEADTRATFFVLGWIVERYPELIRRVHAAGHEIASHGYAHFRVSSQNAKEFREDAGRTKKLLEDAVGCEIKGYRAASFSIGRDNLWALDVLKELGYQYSSSIYPVRHDHYGMPEAPRFAFRYREDGLVEIPITTMSMMGANLPFGGGGYFRLLPYALFRWGLRQVNARDKQAGIFYFHPWELDPGQPRQPGINFKTRFRHYLNLGRSEARIRRLLADFHWGRMDELFLGRPTMTYDPDAIPSVTPASPSSPSSRSSGA